MKFSPINKKPEEILAELGFTSTNAGRGFELQLHNPNRKTPLTEKEMFIPRNRYHAFIEEKEIDIHYDMPKGRNNHKGKNFGRKVEQIIDIFRLIDEGKEYKIRSFYKEQLLKRRTLLT